MVFYNQTQKRYFSCLEFCDHPELVEDAKNETLTNHLSDIVYNYCRFCNYSGSEEFLQRIENNSCKIQCPKNYCGADERCFKCSKYNICDCNGMWGGKCDEYTFFWVPFYKSLAFIFFFISVITTFIATFFSCIPEVVERVRNCKDYSLRTFCVFLVWSMNASIFVGWFIFLFDEEDAGITWILSNSCNAFMLLFLTLSMWCVTILWYILWCFTDSKGHILWEKHLYRNHSLKSKSKLFTFQLFNFRILLAVYIIPVFIVVTAAIGMMLIDIHWFRIVHLVGTFYSTWNIIGLVAYGIQISHNLTKIPPAQPTKVPRVIRMLRFKVTQISLLILVSL